MLPGNKRFWGYEQVSFKPGLLKNNESMGKDVIR